MFEVYSFIVYSCGLDGHIRHIRLDGLNRFDGFDGLNRLNRLIRLDGLVGAIVTIVAIGCKGCRKLKIKKGEEQTVWLPSPLDDVVVLEWTTRQLQ